VNLGNSNAIAGKPHTSLRTVLASSIVGTALEWYDFFLYTTAAATVFGPLFFSRLDGLHATIAAFATFAAGFIARPLGGVLFGMLGDRLGRKRVLIITLLLVGISTTLIGLLPPYASIGYAAPLLLLLLRIVQGLGAGAEYGGAVLIAAEFAPAGKRGLYAGLPYIGVAIGLLLSTGMFWLVSQLPEADFLSWGWRIPFLLSVLIVVLGIFLRFRLSETPVFEELAETGGTVRLPLRELLRTNRRELFCAWGARLGESAANYIFEAFVIVYVTTQLGMEKSIVLSALLAAAALQIVTVPFFASLTDKVGRKPVYMAGALLTGLFAYPFFWLLDSKSSSLIWFAVIFASAVTKTMMVAAQPAWLAELFDARVRFTGFALAREVPTPIGGGIAPLAATVLLSMAGGSPVYVIWYVIGLMAIVFVSLMLAPETYRRSLGPSDGAGPAAQSR